jgi:hypothetical protein
MRGHWRSESECRTKSEGKKQNRKTRTNSKAADKSVRATVLAPHLLAPHLLASAYTYVLESHGSESDGVQKIFGVNN